MYVSNSLSATSVKRTTLMIAIEVDSVGEYDYIGTYIHIADDDDDDDKLVHLLLDVLYFFPHAPLPNATLITR